MAVGNDRVRLNNSSTDELKVMVQETDERQSEAVENAPESIVQKRGEGESLSTVNKDHEEQATLRPAQAESEEQLEKSQMGVGFMELLYGWIPILGYPLSLYNLLTGKKKRAVFFLIYSTVGVVVVFSLKMLGYI